LGLIAGGLVSASAALIAARCSRGPTSRCAAMLGARRSVRGRLADLAVQRWRREVAAQQGSTLSGRQRIGCRREHYGSWA
jgi:hypothetical protein